MKLRKAVFPCWADQEKQRDTKNARSLYDAKRRELEEMTIDDPGYQDAMTDFRNEQENFVKITSGKKDFYFDTKKMIANNFMLLKKMVRLL